MNEGTTKKCPICGRPYKTWPYYAGDQSACPSCVREAENNSKGAVTPPMPKHPGGWQQ